MRHRYRTGDRVVYTRDKYTTKPGPRAKNVFATPNGDAYHYQVEKYWRVQDLGKNGTLLLVTRTGKTHVVERDDPRLRPARWWERIFKAGLFPNLPAASKYAAHSA